MFIVATARKGRAREIERYLYGGQSIVSGPVDAYFGDLPSGSEVVLIESAHGPVGNMLADRLSSGLFGARKFETREEAEVFMREELECRI